MGFAAVLPFTFQSTPPVKAATVFDVIFKVVKDISIHAAREGGDWVISNFTESVIISIHAAREGGDPPGGIRRAC